MDIQLRSLIKILKNNNGLEMDPWKRPVVMGLKSYLEQLTEDENVSVISMRTIMKNDLQLSPYKMRKKQHLIPSQKHKRLERARFLLEELKAGSTWREIFFSDEKFFTIEAIVCNLNDRVYVKSSSDIDDSLRTVFCRQSRFTSCCGLQSQNF